MTSPISLHPPTSGNLITMLNIDGGGIRGVIPGVILQYLESELQELDGKEAMLIDYFDVVSGTSTGGLITAMITAPNEDNRPLFAGKDIVPFYLEHGPKIFKQVGGPFAGLIKLLKTLVGPRYNGKYLKDLVTRLLGTTKLSQTLTNIVIPTFDIKNMQPVIFSSFKVPREPNMDAQLADICMGTSAAPTYLPAHYFQNGDWEFNLIDGGMAANNPSLLAIGEVTRQLMKADSYFPSITPLDYTRYLLISLGTGTQKNTPKFDAKMASRWGVIGWLTNQGSTPLIDAFTQASADLVDIHNNTVFEALNSVDNYLRIQVPVYHSTLRMFEIEFDKGKSQESAYFSFLIRPVNKLFIKATNLCYLKCLFKKPDDTLTGDLASTDIATKENLDGLVKIGEQLLDKPVSRVNINTGVVEPVPNGGTNREALKRFAKRLSDERKLRESDVPDKPLAE